MRRLAAVPALLALASAAAAQKAGESDAILEAMREELKRSEALRVVNLDPPYYIEYAVDDAESFRASATFGGLVESHQSRFRAPRIRVRVGGYKFDNTNFVYSDFAGGTRYEAEQLPLDNVVSNLRTSLWLGTDRMYKAAVEILATKRAALKNMSQSEDLPDFSRAQPVKLLLDAARVRVNGEEWCKRVRSLSGIFCRYPAILSSAVEVESIQSVYYFHNTEGSELRVPERLLQIRVRAAGQAADGAQVRDMATWLSPDPAILPPEAELRALVEATAKNVTALAAAPEGEDYTGPVLFEGIAGCQLLAEVVGRNLRVTRRPVAAPGRPAPVAATEFEGRLGARVLPEWMDIADDPARKEWEGRPLAGSYPVDMEGVIPQPLTLIEKGILKAFLLTRQPVRGFPESNGRARLSGQFGAKMPCFGNLMVTARESLPLAELRKKLIEIAGTRGKPYGIVVRKMDFPSSASIEELRRVMAGAQGAGGRVISSPLLVYRLYQDGREEPVRGLRFRSLDSRALKDIVGASKEMEAFHYLENGAPMALIGGAAYVTAVSAVAPSVLVDDLEMQAPREERPKPPLVPPPLFGAQ